MTTSRLSILVVCVFALGICARAHAWAVLKRSTSPRFILVAVGDAQQWPRGTRLCVFRFGRIVDCGTVAKTSAASAIVRLDGTNARINPGDQVQLAPPEEVARKKLRLGFAIGANIARLGGPGGEGASNRIAAILGPALELDLAEHVGFDLRLLYVEKGAKSDVSSTATLTVRIDYLELSPALRFFTPVGTGGIILSGSAWPFFAFRIHSVADATVGGVTRRADLGSVLKSLDAGIGGGLGLTVPVKSFALRFDLQYSYGLFNIAQSDVVTHTRGLQILIGGLFPL